MKNEHNEWKCVKIDLKAEGNFPKGPFQCFNPSFLNNFYSKEQSTLIFYVVVYSKTFDLRNMAILENKRNKWKFVMNGVKVPKETFSMFQTFIKTICLSINMNFSVYFCEKPENIHLRYMHVSQVNRHCLFNQARLV